MGIYLNPGNDNFKRALRSQIYVDKTGLLSYTNSVLDTDEGYICFSRPRRFGKSMTADMLSAYYGKTVIPEKSFRSFVFRRVPILRSI